MITDENIDIALAAADKTRRQLDQSGRLRMRASLEAVAPAIRAEGYAKLEAENTRLREALKAHTAKLEAVLKPFTVIGPEYDDAPDIWGPMVRLIAHRAALEGKS